MIHSNFSFLNLSATIPDVNVANELGNEPIKISCILMSMNLFQLPPSVFLQCFNKMELQKKLSGVHMLALMPGLWGCPGAFDIWRWLVQDFIVISK